MTPKAICDTKVEFLCKTPQWEVETDEERMKDYLTPSDLLFTAGGRLR